MTERATKIEPRLHWDAIDTVLLDMDGTLLDRYFDDYFWEHHLPETYGRKHGLPLAEAKATLLARYRREEGTLAWTDLDFWSDKLGLDIPTLKLQVEHLIQVHPYVIDFLDFCQKKGKHLHIVTNAHSKTLEIKMRKTAIGHRFHSIVCAGEVGMAKEEPGFWEKLKRIIPYHESRTLLADDNEAVLASARAHGIAHLIYVARPSSTLPVRYSPDFPSIVYFKELISG